MTKKIIVYYTNTCPYCHMAMDYIKEKGMDIEAVNLSEDQSRIQEMVAKSGQMGVPVIDIDGTIIVGFNKEAIDQALS